MALRWTSSFGGTLGFSDTDAQLHLTATNILNYTLPGSVSNKYTILFAYNDTANVYIGYNVTPIIPAANTITEFARMEYRPEARYAVGGDTISFVTPDANVWMGISVRSIPN